MGARRGTVTYSPRWYHSDRQTWLRAFVVAGIACVVAGGLLAAATAYVTTEKTAWATAYLVLVGGVAQAALGAAVAWLAPGASRRFAWYAFVGWNLGNAGVLSGQLAAILPLTYGGTVLLVAALVLVLVSVRAGRQTVVDGRVVRHAAHPGVLWAFRGLVVLLAVTMPIGVILAHLGA